MMITDTQIMELTVCPRCYKPVGNQDYARSGPTLVGATDPRIKCKKCGYVGLPIILSDEDGSNENKAIVEQSFEDE
jgi:hypothetical protein